MKKILLIYFLFASLIGSAQNTWMQKLNFMDGSPYPNDDSLTGIKYIDVGPDGDIFVIGTYGQSNHQELYKISATGSAIKWRTQVGYHGGITGSFTNTVRATSDSGCIVSFNWWGQATWFHIDGEVQKYSKTGTLQWSKAFSGYLNSPQAENEAKDAIEAGNYFYALVGDSVVKFDHSGNILSYDSSCTFPIRVLANGDLLVTSTYNGMARMDTSGNVIWSNTVIGNCGCASEYYFQYGSASVMKIDLADGSLAWTHPYPWNISSIDPTPDGGFVASYGIAPSNLSSLCFTGCQTPGFMFRADLNGDTLWTRTYNFPYYGLPRVKMHPSGSIITGGAFLYTNKEHTFFARDYSSFLCSLDSLGHGPLETTTLTWPGDANDNQVVGFADDALNVGIAWGDTGPARDTVDMAYSMFSWMPGTFSDYASDWQLSFAGGENHKHADFNGDGVIDTSDLTPYSMGYYFPFNIPSWRFASTDEQQSQVADFRLAAQYDTVGPGDGIRYYIIAGSSSVPADSIYGLVFGATYDNTLLSDTPLVSLYNSDLGTVGSDLVTYGFQGSWGNNFYAMSCRTNHQDVFNLNDTIGEILMTAATSISSPQTFTMNITDFKALTFHETPVTFNLLADAVVIDPVLLSVSDKISGDFLISPNPASDQFAVFSPQFAIQSIEIFNTLGEPVYKSETNCESCIIHCESFPAGIYVVKAAAKGKTFFKKLVKSSRY